MSNHTPRFAVPSVFVLFGVTGDLVRTKILPSFFSLYTKKLLPEKLQIYGFSRRDLTDQSLRDYIRNILVESGASRGTREVELENFLNCFFLYQWKF